MSDTLIYIFGVMWDIYINQNLIFDVFYMMFLKLSSTISVIISFFLFCAEQRYLKVFIYAALPLSHLSPVPPRLITMHPFVLYMKYSIPTCIYLINITL